MKMLFPAKSKRGVTLVEVVFAVVILGLFATGILGLLIAGNAKINESYAESNKYVQASAQLDLVLAAISNGSDKYIIKDLNAEPATCKLDVAMLKQELGLTADTVLTAETSLYNNLDSQNHNPLYASDTVQELYKIRGWYITLTYQGATVKGFASNSEGVFDN